MSGLRVQVLVMVSCRVVPSLGGCCADAPAGAGDVGLVFSTLDYDYTTQEWFSIPVNQRKDRWSLPYFDLGGGDIWMVRMSLHDVDTALCTAAC